MSKLSFLYRVTFLTGPALNVLSVGDGKIPTKKVKARVSHRENMKSYLKLPFLVGILPSPTLRTFRAEPVKKNHPVFVVSAYLIAIKCGTNLQSTKMYGV